MERIEPTEGIQQMERIQQMEFASRCLRRMQEEIQVLKQYLDTFPVTENEQVYYSHQPELDLYKVDELRYRIAMMKHYCTVYENSMKEILEGKVVMIPTAANAALAFKYFANTEGVFQEKITQGHTILCLTPDYINNLGNNSNWPNHNGEPWTSQWNTEIALGAIRKSFIERENAAKQHFVMWESLREELQKKGLWKRLEDLLGATQLENIIQYYYDQANSLTLFAFILFDSDKDIENAGFNPHYFRKNLENYVKVTEIGLVLGASVKKHMYDEPLGIRGHDWIAYLALLVSQGHYQTIQGAMNDNMAHEGRHGIIDGLIGKILQLNLNCPAGEGWVIAIHAERPPLLAQVPDFELIINPSTNYVNMYTNIAYNGWPRFFQTLYFLDLDRLNNDFDVRKFWEDMSIALLKAAIEIAEDLEFLNLDDAVKIGILAKKIIEKLGFTQEQVEEMYKQISADRTHYLEQMTPAL